MLNKVEECKILLSKNNIVNMKLPFIDSSTTIQATINEFEDSIYNNTNKIKKAFDEFSSCLFLLKVIIGSFDI